MIYKERFLHVLRFPHLSEKASLVMEKYNVVVFNVNKMSTKSDIKSSVEQLFSVNVCAVRTVIVKGKIKKRGKKFGRTNDWKKAYVTLTHGQKIDFSDTKIMQNIN